IRGRASKPGVEGVAASGNRALPDAGALEILFEPAERGVKGGECFRLRVALAENRAGHAPLLFWLQRNLEARFRRAQGGGLGRKFQAGGAEHLVQTAVGKNCAIDTGAIRQSLAFAGALWATPFKNIGEVAVELRQQRDCDRLQAVVQ